MANRSFVVKQISNIKVESEWISDETYQILPNEEVLAICNKTVGEGESAQNYVYIRSKVNTTTTPKLFKELKYSDEYVEVQIDSAVGDLEGTVNTQIQNLTSRVGDVETVSTGLRNDLNDVSGQVEEMSGTVSGINTKVTKNTTDITNLTTTVEGNTTNITKNTEDITALTTKVDTNTTNITDLTSRVSDTETVDTGLRKDINDVTTQMETLDGTVTTLSGKVTTNTQNIAKNAQDIADLSSSVEEQINTKIASAYKAAGSVADVANLPVASASILGNVYNMTADFTTTDIFVEGSGKKFPAGTNVVVVEATTGTYKYDVLSGMVDLTAYSTTEQMNTAITNAVTNGVGTDVASLTTRVQTLEEDNLSQEQDIQNMETQLAEKADKTQLSSYLTTSAASTTYMPKTGGTFTGAIKTTKPATSSNDTTVPTTSWVTDKLASAGSGKKWAVLSSSKPASGTLEVGGIWYKQL